MADYKFKAGDVLRAKLDHERQVTVVRLGEEGSHDGRYLVDFGEDWIDWIWCGTLEEDYESETPETGRLYRHEASGLTFTCFNGQMLCILGPESGPWLPL